jgi:hypothetical protein
LPQRLSIAERHVISIRRAEDQQQLAGSPCMLEAAVAATDPNALRRMLDAAVLGMGREAEMAQVIGFLESQLGRLLQARADLPGICLPQSGSSELPPAAGWSDPAKPLTSQAA